MEIWTCPINAITDDSRTVSTDSLFVAVKGERVDGHEFIPVAMRAGMARIGIATAGKWGVSSMHPR